MPEPDSPARTFSNAIHPPMLKKAASFNASEF
jgi:hypothetical protein